MGAAVPILGAVSAMGSMFGGGSQKQKTQPTTTQVGSLFPTESKPIITNPADLSKINIPTMHMGEGLMDVASSGYNYNANSDMAKLLGINTGGGSAIELPKIDVNYPLTTVDVADQLKKYVGYDSNNPIPEYENEAILGPILRASRQSVSEGANTRASQSPYSSVPSGVAQDWSTNEFHKARLNAEAETRAKTAGDAFNRALGITTLQTQTNASNVEAARMKATLESQNNAANISAAEALAGLNQKSAEDVYTGKLTARSTIDASNLQADQTRAAQLWEAMQTQILAQLNAEGLNNRFNGAGLTGLNNAINSVGSQPSGNTGIDVNAPTAAIAAANNTPSASVQSTNVNQPDWGKMVSNSSAPASTVYSRFVSTNPQYNNYTFVSNWATSGGGAADRAKTGGYTKGIVIQSPTGQKFVVSEDSKKVWAM